MPRSRTRRNAQVNALLRFRPEEDVLLAAVRQAYANRRLATRQAHGQAEGLISAVAETMPAARKVYRDQAKSQRFAADVYGTDIAELGPVADSIEAGAALERRTARDQLAQARSGTLTGLTQQRIAARAGEQFAVAKGRSDFIADIKEILAQKASLADRKGAFVQSEIARLADAAADRRIDLRQISQSERNSQRTAGIDPDTGRPIPGGKLDPRPDPKDRFDATPATYKDANKQIGKAIAVLGQLDPEKDPAGRHDYRRLLITGHDSQPIYATDPTTGKRTPALDKNGIPKVTPEIPAIDKAYAIAAVQMYYDGHISRQTIKTLHDLGIKVKRLPVKPPTGRRQRRDDRQKDRPGPGGH